MLRADDALSFPAFRKWRKYPQLCRGKFSKQEFSATSLQYGKWTDIRISTSGGCEIEQKEKLVGGTRRFESELCRAREALPADKEARSEGTVC